MYFVALSQGVGARFAKLREPVLEALATKPIPLLALSCVLVALLSIFWVLRTWRKETTLVKPSPKSYPPLPKDAYDVCIVGAGPAGSVTAYFCARAGLRVLLLEKKKFPRQKICGDAVCTLAQDIMERMESATGKGSVLDEILREGKGHPASNGGLVSPAGYSYIGNSVGEGDSGKLARSAVIAIKRIVLDEKLARSAAYAGANLLEEVSVESARFDTGKALWSISGERTGSAPEEASYQARVLVCADGAPSRLAMQLGIVKEAPQGTCSRAYVKAGSHNYAADGTVIYNLNLLPGYMAIFREVNDELNYCCYIIPGNPRVRNDDLSRLHHGFVKEDFYLSRALGPRAELEPMKAGSLRLGGVPRSYADNLLIVGDAAGFIDPLTGEGIHHAMDSGVMAAEVLKEAFKHSDMSARFLSNYQRRWMRAFGYDFKASMRLAQILYRFPILLDAATLCIEKQGDEFLAEWARIMTGQRPKSQLFRPYIMFAMAKELILLVILRTLGLERKPIDDVRKHQ
jgi:geranylgeranyl reductase family protein